jgi:MYXO-CTERM domain-containing protein
MAGTTGAAGTGMATGAAGESGQGGSPAGVAGSSGQAGASGETPDDRGVTGGCACDTAASDSASFAGLVLSMLAFAGAISRRPRPQRARRR